MNDLCFKLSRKKFRKVMLVLLNFKDFICLSLFSLLFLYYFMVITTTIQDSIAKILTVLKKIKIEKSKSEHYYGLKKQCK